jgi:hypothetical protein
MSYWIPRVDHGKIKWKSKTHTGLMKKVLAPSYAIAFDKKLNEDDPLIEEARKIIRKKIRKDNVMGGVYPRWV